MNGKAQLIVGFVVDLIVAEGNVANGEIIKITPVGGFKSGYGDVGFGIELPGDPSADGIQFNAV